MWEYRTFSIARYVSEKGIGAGMTRLDVFADHHQFYLMDTASEADTSKFWDDREFLDMLATGSGMLGVGTARNTFVPVTVRVTDSEPEEDPARWDHVMEASLAVPSGELMVLGPSESRHDAAHIGVEPGDYRARVHYRGLDSVSAGGLEGEDAYEVTLWPGTKTATRVLKRSSWTTRNL